MKNNDKYFCPKCGMITEYPYHEYNYCKIQCIKFSPYIDHKCRMIVKKMFTLGYLVTDFFDCPEYVFTDIYGYDKYIKEYELDTYVQSVIPATENLKEYLNQAIEIIGSIHGYKLDNEYYLDFNYSDRDESDDDDYVDEYIVDYYEALYNILKKKVNKNDKKEIYEERSKIRKKDYTAEKYKDRVPSGKYYTYDCIKCNTTYKSENPNIERCPQCNSPLIKIRYEGLTFNEMLCIGYILTDFIENVEVLKEFDLFKKYFKNDMGAEYCPQVICITENHKKYLKDAVKHIGKRHGMYLTKDFRFIFDPRYFIDNDYDCILINCIDSYFNDVFNYMINNCIIPDEAIKESTKLRKSINYIGDDKK